MTTETTQLGINRITATGRLRGGNPPQDWCMVIAASTIAKIDLGCVPFTDRPYLYDGIAAQVTGTICADTHGQLTINATDITIVQEPIK